MVARKLLVMSAVAAGLVVSSTGSLTAAPANPGGILELLKSGSTANAGLLAIVALAPQGEGVVTKVGALTTSSDDGAGSRRDTMATSAPAERLKMAARFRSEVPVTL